MSSATCRPVVTIHCTDCQKPFFTQRLRGKWIGEVRISESAPFGVLEVYNVIDGGIHGYVCYRCRAAAQESGAK